MTLNLKYREYLTKVSEWIVRELDQLNAVVRTTFRAEHNDDGTHKARRSVTLTTAAGVTYYLWVDATGDLRVGTASPTVSDTGGTIVGTQS